MTYEQQKRAAELLARVYSDNPEGVEYGHECLYSAYAIVSGLLDRVSADLADARAKLADADKAILTLQHQLTDHTRTRMVAALTRKDTK